MVKHIVLFKLKSKESAKDAKGALLGMKGKIEGLLDIEVGEDFLESERSYDLALICTFESRKALELYQEHPVHMPVKKLMHELRTASCACDFDC